MKRGKLFAALYQLAGERLLMQDALTKGQRVRLTELLLNVLCDPDRYTAKIVSQLHRDAKLP